MKRYIADEKTDLKTFTDNTCPQASFVFRALLKAREIRVNGEKVSENVTLERGDEVRYFLTPSQEAKRAFSVVYEDEQILVADKESGVNSEAVFRETGLFPVHRLDRNTAGILLLAKSEAAQRALLSAFRERRAEKIYHALVVGRPEKTHAVERAYLVKDAASSLVKISSSPVPFAEPIVTEYELLEPRGEESLLKVTLHTGKTHQIRAHLAFLGHPVVGDGKYGDAAYNRSRHAARQKLVAKSLTLRPGGILSYLDGKTFLSEKNL